MCAVWCCVWLCCAVSFQRSRTGRFVHKFMVASDCLMWTSAQSRTVRYGVEAKNRANRKNEWNGWWNETQDTISMQSKKKNKLKHTKSWRHDNIFYYDLILLTFIVCDTTASTVRSSIFFIYFAWLSVFFFCLQVIFILFSFECFANCMQARSGTHAAVLQ